MSLVLEIEFLTGVCRAAHEAGDDAPDWPPQPDRVFSALVSPRGRLGDELPDERRALEWLEAFRRHQLFMRANHTARTTPDVFVPPNDFQTPRNDLDKLKWYRDHLAHGERPPERGRQQYIWKQALSILPEDRQSQETPLSHCPPGRSD